MQFSCSSCGARLQIGDDRAGRPARCAFCRGIGGSNARRDDGASDAAAVGAGLGIGAIIAIVVAVLGCLGGCGVVAVLIALLVPAVQKTREAANRAVTINNMKQMALACHNFNDTFKQLPTPKASNPPAELGWRVSILPFVEQAALYNSIDRTAAWDSPRNTGPSSAVVPVYQDIMRQPPGNVTSMTHFQYFTGPGTVWSDNKPKTLQGDFPAGLSQTFLFGEAANPVPWARPADMVVQPGQPLPLRPIESSSRSPTARCAS